MIRPAEPADAAMLAELAARTFSDTFGADNRPEDLELHLARSYGVAQQSAELADPAITTLIAEVDRQPAGYTQIKAGPPPDCIPAADVLEIMRFYVDRRWHGRGIAQQLMAAAVDTAQGAQASALWLGVWERNARAIAFYEKCGFRPAGRKEFWVGQDRQNDLVMVRPL